jgi:hypothetical protein
MTKKIITIVILSLTLLLSTPSRNNVFAQNAQCPYNIASFTVTPTNPSPTDQRIIYNITVSQPRPPDPFPLYVFINYRYSAADNKGYSYNGVPPTRVIIGANGSGVEQYILGDIYNGTYTLAISEDIDGLNLCPAPATSFSITGRLDPPSKTNCSRDLGDACIPGATDNQICNIEQNYCGIGQNGFYVVKRRNCNEIGGGCCRTVSTSLNNPSLLTFTCNTGVPSEQNDKCICNFAPPPPPGEKQWCDSVGRATTVKTGRLWTAIGCIPIDFISTLTQKLIGFAIGVAGGVAFILILYAGFEIITSQGDIYKIKNGRELLTAAITALLMVIFATTLLRLIGVDILKIIR